MRGCRPARRPQALAERRGAPALGRRGGAGRERPDSWGEPVGFGGFRLGALAAGTALHLAGMALRAKVAAALLHPQRRPWKALATAAFEAARPGLGPAAMLTSLRPGTAAAARLAPRLAS